MQGKVAVINLKESQNIEFKQSCRDEYIKVLSAHSSEPYNPAIAYPFFLTGYIEAWGRGIEKIIEESEKFNGITPHFRWLNGLWVEFYFNEVGRKDLEKDLKKDLEEKLSQNQAKIIELIDANPHITQAELSKAIGINEKNIRNNIKKLKEKNIIKRVGAAKGGHWKILL